MQLQRVWLVVGVQELDKGRCRVLGLRCLQPDAIRQTEPVRHRFTPGLLLLSNTDLNGVMS